MVIEEEGVPWYYDIMKFLELEVYPDGADKRERPSIRIMVMQYILVAIDYFDKYVEAASYFVLKAKHVARFIENNIIFHYVVPQEIIFDNGSHFEGDDRIIMELYNIEHHKSSPYRP